MGSVDRKMTPADRKMASVDQEATLESGPKLPNNPDSPTLIKRAEELAKYIGNKKELYRDVEAWSAHQELAKLLKAILITDLDYGLEKKVEQLLWNSCFKNYIAYLQTKSKDKRSKDRAEAQVTLSWFLENASGFYILFLEEIRLTFSLSVPFLQAGSPYGTVSNQNVGKPSKKPSKASCNYICQHCLVHLGDIARYRHSLQQAESFYRHAISMAPSSGQPYNQIAILEASRSNKLSTVYFYVRAVSLNFPFPAAFTNLGKLLGKLAGLGDNEDKETRDRSAKVTQHTFIPLFLRIQGMLQHSVQLVQCVKYCKLLTESFTSLVATDSISTWQLLQMISINMWVWDQAQATANKDELSTEERVTLGICAELQAAILSSILLPVYTVKKGTALLDYYALPAVRILLDWIYLRPDCLKERGFTSRPQIWPSLARLLNELQELNNGFDPSSMVDYPLPEEYDLQAFQPLQFVLSRYNYKVVSSGHLTDKDQLARLRFTRILDTGAALTKEPLAVLQQDVDQWKAVEKEYRQAEDLDSLVEGLDSVRDDSTDDDEDNSNIEVEGEVSTSRGILKTKSGSKDPEPETSTAAAPRYRARQNVAMAAILRANQSTLKVEEDTEKRVMFKTPSPTQTNKDKDPSGPEGKEEGVKGKGPKGGVVPASAMSVNQMDFSKPPPSLHSNYRPPKLTGSGGEQIAAAVEPPAVKGILQLHPHQSQIDQVSASPVFPAYPGHPGSLTGHPGSLTADLSTARLQAMSGGSAEQFPPLGHNAVEYRSNPLQSSSNLFPNMAGLSLGWNSGLGQTSNLFPGNSPTLSFSSPSISFTTNQTQPVLTNQQSPFSSPANGNTLFSNERSSSVMNPANENLLFPNNDSSLVFQSANAQGSGQSPARGGDQGQEPPTYSLFSGASWPSNILAGRVLDPAVPSNMTDSQQTPASPLKRLLDQNKKDEM